MGPCFANRFVLSLGPLGVFINRTSFASILNNKDHDSFYCDVVWFSAPQSLPGMGGRQPIEAEVLAVSGWPGLWRDAVPTGFGQGLIRGSRVQVSR